jgi:hypothetical protein
MLQLLAKADSEYKRLVQLGQWTTKNKSSELFGLQSKFNVLQTQFHALMAEHSKIKTKQQQPLPTTGKPNGPPKPEEHDTCTIDGTTWYYYSNCWAGRRWNRTHQTANHKCGIGKNRNQTGERQQPESNIATYDTTYSGFSDF